MTQARFDPPPRAVFFDLDDTLCDYATARLERLRYVFTRALDGRAKAGAEIDLDRMIADSIQMHPHGADHFGTLFVGYGIDDPAKARSAAAWYRKNRFFALDLFLEAREVLLAVGHTTTASDRPDRRRLGIITNGPTEVQRAKLDRLEIRDLVDVVIISEEFGAAKPDPAIFHEALHRVGFRAEEAVFIGDSAEFDMAGARAAGIPSVWLNRQGAAWTEPDWTPDREIRSLRDVPQLIS